jgi:hypothetical protein
LNTRFGHTEVKGILIRALLGENIYLTAVFSRDSRTQQVATGLSPVRKRTKETGWQTKRNLGYAGLF